MPTFGSPPYESPEMREMEKSLITTFEESNKKLISTTKR